LDTGARLFLINKDDNRLMHWSSTRSHGVEELAPEYAHNGNDPTATRDIDLLEANLWLKESPLDTFIDRIRYTDERYDPNLMCQNYVLALSEGSVP